MKKPAVQLHWRTSRLAAGNVTLDQSQFTKAGRRDAMQRNRMTLNEAGRTWRGTVTIGGGGVTDSRLSSTLLHGGRWAGTLVAGVFLIGASAAAADDRFICNSGTGALQYDSDGNGACAAV